MISTYQAKIQRSKHMQGLFDIKCLYKAIIVAMRAEGLMWYFRVIWKLVEIIFSLQVKGGSCNIISK